MDDTGKIRQEEMEQVLTSINETASYFGDPVLKRSQVKVRCSRFRHHARCDARAWYSIMRFIVTIAAFWNIASLGIIEPLIMDNSCNRPIL